MTDESNYYFGKWAELATLYHTGDWRRSVSNQIVKLMEELGETAQAYIGTIGQNPRKGVTHTYEDVASELVDVIVTGHVALATVLGGNPDDARQYFTTRTKAIFERQGLVDD